MNTNIEKIVEEICELAPELREKKEDVVRVVETLVENKPNVVIDAAFIEDLRTRLQGSIRAQKVSQPQLSETITQKIMNITNNRLAFSVAAVAFVLIASVSFFGVRGNGLYQSDLALAPQIQDVGKKVAFGSLVSSDSMAENTRMEKSAANMALDSVESSFAVSEESAMGGGYQSDGMDMAVTMVAPEPMLYDDEMVESSMIMPRWEYTHPIYTFNGSIPDIDAEGYVYRRLQGIETGGLNSIVNNLDVGLVDISSFASANVEHIQFSSKGDPGYSISVDLKRGTVSINRNWNDDVRMMDSTSFTRDQINDKEFIKIANAFMKKHNIDISSYGEPQILVNEMYYAEMYAREDEAVSSKMIPIHSVSIRYPLIIGGMRVVDQGGSVAGITVSVNVSTKYVESVWGLETQGYEKSLYELTQDKAQIIEMVKNGGVFGGRNQNYNKSVEVPVGEPEFVLMRYWKYESGIDSQELLIPALFFDVDQTKWNTQGVYVQDAIVIPLVKDIVDNSWPVPMPLMDATGAPEPAIFETTAVEVLE